MTLIRLLIVDDHDAFLNAAERHLRRVAHVAIIGRGRNGIEAVALADELKPDVVVLDLAMPEMGGLQATRLIKAQDEPPFVENSICSVTASVAGATFSKKNW